MKFRHLLIPILAVATANLALADGFIVDKVYHPYVEAMTQEFELRAVAYDDYRNLPRGETYRLAYGRAFGDRWFGELYLAGQRTSNENLELEGYEAEVLHQITEQGEYWADWAVIMEVEKQHTENIWEASTGVVMEKEFGQWSTAVNLLVTSEWGETVQDELESRLAVQTRYRFREWLEPALELHSGENSKALGPAMLGDIRLGNGRRLHWEVGAFTALDDDTPDYSFRAGVEYEFR